MKNNVWRVMASASFVFALVSATEVRADLDDGTPWNWKAWDDMISKRTDVGNQSTCEELAKSLENPSLQCPIDHAS